MFKFLTVTCQLKDSNQRLIPGVMRPYSEICMNAVFIVLYSHMRSPGHRTLPCYLLSYMMYRILTDQNLH